MFVISIVGLLLLQPKTTTLDSLNHVGKVYRLCGSLIPIREMSKGCVYTFVEGNDHIRAVAFFGECIGGYSCILGRLEEYRGEKEIVILSFD